MATATTANSSALERLTDYANLGAASPADTQTVQDTVQDTVRRLDNQVVVTAEAVAAGAEAVSFHECCICGYTFLQSATREQLTQIAERVPDGPRLCSARFKTRTTSLVRPAANAARASPSAVSGPDSPVNA